ncbi:hypothetical protein KFK09_005601 [Dendrobium nobile]|uniref:Reverse transcriptase domain-containing protein n=1 Tax=Dendrobium nobile TaxID=94219 RepID=A0A8T3BW97_DENNO|nr:hypothetical protein KFK09_005601 [Dendrobium nobile]
MANLSSQEEFPPLSSKSVAPVVAKTLSYSNIVASPRPGNAFKLSSSVLPDDSLEFNEVHVKAASDEWGLALVGYSIGRRPYYESLLSAMRKVWKLKGMMKLISLSDGFFMLKFSAPEDYDMALNGGVWFFLGKPFVLQKWVPNFKPVREEFTSIPIWFKILDLPLPCWTPEGISRIASKIGTPLAVDDLTAEKSRLTYARVCVQVSKDCTYPETIPISILGEPFFLKIQYEWKPIQCEHCGSIVHTPDFCPSKPQTDNPPSQPPPRGRSTSRKPPRAHSRNTKFQPVLQSAQSTDKLPSSVNDTESQKLTDQPSSSKHPDLTNSQPSKSDPPVVDIQNLDCNIETAFITIPNLNSPTEESSSSILIPQQQDKVISPNKFAILQENSNEKTHPPPSSVPDKVRNNTSSQQKASRNKVRACKDLASNLNLDLLCVLENRIHEASFSDPWFQLNHSVFQNEESCHNFNLSTSGRIWIKWDPLLIQFKPSLFTKQLISGELYRGQDLLCVLSVVYASNSVADRNLLWDNLRVIGNSINSPWLIAGDFNCCLYVHEKSGGMPLLDSHIWDFNSLKFDLGLLDLASKGLKFTWFNQRANVPIHLKLDRMLVNDKWLDTYYTSYYEVLPPNCSDHSPIALFSGQNFKAYSRFLFKNFWTNQDGFWADTLNIFSKPIRGNPIIGLYGKLKSLKESIKSREWVNSSFLSNQLASLKDQQSSCIGMLNSDPQNADLNQKLKSLNAQLSDCSSSWTNWMLQRAKLKWLAKGEDDLKFLYARIKTRRNISASTLIASEDSSIRQDLIKSITRHFEILFNAARPNHSLEAFPIPKGKVIPTHLVNLLTIPVSDVEIKEAIFHGSSNSSPGPDGFNFEFYKSTWLITGPLVCKAVKSFFSKGYLPINVKATAIALIPKSTHASNVTDFRPIALCNVFYKIISKILASRMKDIMPLIIEKNQAGFIKKRIATDNILLASEILFDFKKTAKMNLMCAKLDIRKAFDSVSREFILTRMRQKGFPLLFIQWVKACISDVHFSICIDGGLEGYFNSSSGIRQGCPLSPYLFCIAMDAFSCLIDNDTSQNRFIGIQKQGMNLSHLLYADDLLIFGDASISNCAVLKEVLKHFAMVSGLLVNHDKSQVILSSHISNHMAVCEALNLPTSSTKMIYLGLPISIKKNCKSDFQPLLNSISNHLSGWKARLLSIAGRLQYLKYTVCNKIAYWLRGTVIPKSCIKTLSRMFYNDNSPLFEFLNAKYGTPWTPALCKPSPLWVEIGKVAILIEADVGFAFKHDNIISLLWDPWFQGGSLHQAFTHHSLDSIFNHNAKVIDFLGMSGWTLPASNFGDLNVSLGSLRLITDAKQVLYWKDAASSSFSSFLKFYYKEEAIVDWRELVWHKHYALKYSIYSWIAINGGLKTAEELRKRSIFVAPNCVLCGSHFETNPHIMFECDYAFSVITYLVPVLGEFLLRPRLLQVIHYLGELDNLIKHQKELLLLTTSCAAYFLWRERNERRFNFKFRSVVTLCNTIKLAVEMKISSWKFKESLELPWKTHNGA